jgi:hypothetical protein
MYSRADSDEGNQNAEPSHERLGLTC